MSHRLAVAGAAFALLLMSATAGAQQPQQPMNAQEAKAKFAEKFKEADADHDGKLTREEAEAGMPNVAKDFDKIDAKKKGFVTQKQIGAYYAAKAKQRRAQDPGNLN
jgi:hypothetical protein